MSTPSEQREVVQYSIEVAKKRLQALKNLQASGFISKAQMEEMKKTIVCIQLGEKILGVQSK